MTTFPTFTPPGEVNASPGTTITTKPRARVANFGDGYAQRSPDGLNTIMDQMDLSIDVLTRTEAATVIAFFKERRGTEAFWFTAPGDTEPKKWVATEWSRMDSGRGSVDIRASLMEVVDP